MLSVIEAKDWYLLGIGAMVGGTIGYLISWRFAVSSRTELKREAAALRRVLEVLVHGMESQGWIEVTRDDEGKTRGLVFRITPAPAQLNMTGQPPAAAVGMKGAVGITGDIKVHTSDEDKCRH